MGRKRIDRVGQKFNMLTVVEELPGGKELCICDCGNLSIVEKDKVVSGLIRSCGCMHRGKKIDCNDIIGKTFGKLTVLSCEGRINRRYVYMCKCACGRTVSVSRDHLIGKMTQSCGCLRSDNNVSVTASISTNLYSERKGVSYNKKLNRWYANLSYKNMYYYLGSSSDCKEAEAMRNRAEEETKKYGKVITYVSCKPIIKKKG